MKVAISHMQWDELLQEVAMKPPGVNVKIDKADMPHPRELGFRRSLGTPKGQYADYRQMRSDGSGFHVLVFRKHYKVHWDRIDPATQLIRHLAHDAPGVLAAACVAVAATVALPLLS